MCETFHCTPSAAVKEIEDGHLGLALDIIEMRAFASAWDEWHRNVDKTKVTDSPMMDTVKSVAFHLMHEQRAHRATD